MIALAWVGRALSLLGIPTWVPIAALMAVAAGAGAYVKGRMDAAGNCREEELRAIIVSMQRDVSAQEQADRLEAAKLVELERERRDLEQEVADYEAELAKRPDEGCALGPDDLRALDGVSGHRKR